MITSKTVPTYAVTVYMAGDYDDALRCLRSECWQKGLCVTVRRTRFVYTGGEEDGVEVGFVNYPRFPSTEEEIDARVLDLTQLLMQRLCQRTALVVSPKDTVWLSRKAPGASEEK